MGATTEPDDDALLASGSGPVGEGRVGLSAGPSVGPSVGLSVGAVAQRLGIAAPTLRSWDRRHGIGPSLRTSGNHRRYTTLDVRRVELMARLTGQGVPAQRAADAVLALDDESLEERVVPLAGEGGVPSAGDDGSAGDLVEALVAAARALDSRTLGEVCRQVLQRRGVVDAWVEVIAPALRRLGDLWAQGRLGVQAEHLASEAVQSELRALVRANRARTVGPPVVLASADDEQHHLPLLALEAHLGTEGIACLFLGPRVPTEALATAVREARPPAVFLWASLQRRVDEPLWGALQAVDRPLQVVVGGPGWPAEVGQAASVRVTRVDDLGSAVAALVAASGGARR